VGAGDRKRLRHIFVIFLVYLVCMKKYLFIVLLVCSWSCGGGINIFGNGNGGGGGNGNGGSRAPGLIIYNSTNCNLWSGSIVTIFNNSSGYVSDEILIQGIGNSYSESIYLDSAGTYQLQVKFFKSDGGNLNKSFSVNVSETSMTKYEITCN
tara:strand:+ start:63 stop:518 length:456 start_codon:yes stop_codon:yes gene_type:complete